MLSSLKHIFFPARKPARQFTQALEVSAPAYLIGDVHGCYEPLARLLEVIDQHESKQEKALLIFLGDYVDRGENSRRVLSLLQAMSRDRTGSVTFLRGNHDQMFLDFLKMPGASSRTWLKHGGLQTLASFGIGGLNEGSSPDDMQRASETLNDKVPDGLTAWLSSLQLTHVNGNLVATHAGGNPSVPMDQQSQDSLLWGHPDLQNVPRGDGIWVAHGHYASQKGSVQNGRISTDTGAYYSGVLTAAFVAPGEAVTFLNSEGQIYS